MSGASTRTVLAALAGLLLTATIAAVPALYFAYHAPDARVVVETTTALVELLVAFLCLGRYRRHHRLSDLAIVGALLLLTLDYPLFVALPRALWPNPGERVETWAPLGAQALAAAILASAGVVMLSGRRSAKADRVRTLTAVAFAAVAVGVGALVWIAPHDAASVLSPKLSERPDPRADPLVAAVQFGTAILFALAASRLSVAASRRKDAFLDWLGVGCALGAAAGLNYALFPSLNPTSLHTGDLIWSGAVIAWAIGAVGEISSYWSEIGRLARAEERRRLARDLHDGLAQELAFLVTHTQVPVAHQAEPRWLAELQGATERALAESRRAIAALVADDSMPLEADVGQAALDIAGRTGARVELDIEYGHIPPAHQETLVRIVREAVTNATRHGKASVITISFAGGPRPVFHIADNGSGFDPSAVNRSRRGFGLVSMRERAEALGASLAVHSEPGKGTTVEIAWP